MVILPSVYAPSVRYMSMLLETDTQIEAHEHYQKQTYRNRCAIASPQGILHLTIPIAAGANTQCPIQEVRIAEHDAWRHKHWQAIQSYYSSAPYFEYYAPDLEPLYHTPEVASKRLFTFNRLLIERLCTLIHLPYRWQQTDSYRGSNSYPDPLDRLLAPRHRSASNPRPYYQIFAHRIGFIDNLSCLDLLFNMGPESLLVLHDLKGRK